MSAYSRIRPGKTRLCPVALLAFFLVQGSALAALLEEQIRVPVKVADAKGREVEHSIVVTLWYDSTAPRPYPVLVLNHGRAGRAADRAAMGRARYSAASKWFAGHGFMVAVPTRVGYGVTGGADVEDSGPCSRKNYPPVYLAAAVQTLKVLEVLRERSWVARDRAIVVGQSFGGTTAITIASMNPDTVQGGINFAGGGGGRPDTHPQDPCAQPGLKRLFADYGRTARMPTLWIYADEDAYFGPKLPKAWFDAFKAAGGAGDYALFPGPHGLFTSAPQLWQPRVLEFLKGLGYRPIQ
jgi:dienelactone hydrolase